MAPSAPSAATAATVLSRVAPRVGTTSIQGGPDLGLAEEPSLESRCQHGELAVLVLLGADIQPPVVPAGQRLACSQMCLALR